jgi:hypothetical protein
LAQRFERTNTIEKYYAVVGEKIEKEGKKFQTKAPVETGAFSLIMHMRK